MLPAIFVSHGAPTLALDLSPAREFLAGLGRDLDVRFGRPRAIVVFSAHWETSTPTVSTAAEPATIHDFSGFPERLYRLRYPAPGAVEVAREALALLPRAKPDPLRGLDHGAWVPLSLMYPQADVPVAQISIQPHLGPRHAFAIGEASRPLRERNVLVLGSGSITHNLRELIARPSAEPTHVREFADWISAQAEAGDREALLDYRRRAPHASRNHPTDEHLLPFFTVLGAAFPAEPIRRIHTSVTFGALRMDAYQAT